MKKILYVLILLSVAGCKKAVDSSQPATKHAIVLDDASDQPLPGVTVTIDYCKGSGIFTSCDPLALINTDAGGGFTYDRKANHFVFAKAGYIPTVVDLLEALPPNASLSNNKLLVRMKK